MAIIKTLAMDMFNIYLADPSIVKLNLDVVDLMLDVNTAIPIGLILNELLTNSMKYTFPHTGEWNKSNHKGNGTINVRLFKDADSYALIVEDNGVGFQEDIDIENSDSLGLQLVNILTTQINGLIHLDRNNGTSFKINFNEKK